MSDRWTDRLSEYIDGGLSAGERRELEAHLAGCGECAQTLEELGRIVAQAAALEDRPPAADLWEGIAARIEAKSRSAGAARVVDLDERRASRNWAGRRFTLSLPQLAAAAVMLMFVSGGAAWLLSDEAEPIAPRAETRASPAGSGSVLVSGELSSEYDAAIAELEGLIADNREELNPQTVRIIEENLRVIDQAIAQAQRALEQDPASVYLNEHLASTMRQKLEFLRHAASVARAAS